ncbi:MAG: Slp family lipoprotein [Syntrophobacterales bacterium]|jgi:outer membrane lipoprotein
MLFYTASCSVISSQVRKEAEPPVEFKTLMKEANAYVGRTVIVGGYILATDKLADKSVIVTLQAPLGFRSEPKSRDKSQGRFIVVHKDFLDPAVYRKGRKITVAGYVFGITTEDEVRCPNTCLNIESREIHLWPEYYYQGKKYDYGDPPYPSRLILHDPTW